MDNGQHQQQNFESQQSSGQWPPQHQYPHSHHGTPAQEYAGFNWPQPLPMDTSFQMATMPQRSHHQMLQPLVMPQWPSMLGSQASYKVLPLGQQPPVATIAPVPSMPIATPISASSTGSAATPRRTLTDEDRRRMCLYQEKNPSLKQTDIGAAFGVDRSTVSKVLRQKEKYLERDKRGRSANKREKGRMPEVERALSNWARNHQKKGNSLSDESIREKASYFAATVGGEDNNPASSSVWVDKFKRKHSSTKSRKNSLAPDETEAGSNEASGGADSKSPESIFSLSPSGLHDARSQESLRVGSPDSFSHLTNSPQQRNSQSTSSLKSAFTDQTSYYTPISASGTSPVTQKQPRPIAPASATTKTQRPQSNTYDTYTPPTDTSHSRTPKYTLFNLDSPMSEFAHILESPDEDEHEARSPQRTINTGSPRQKTISPSETLMRAPPLPSSARHFKSESSSNPASSIESRLASTLGSHKSLVSTSTSPISSQQPTPDDARRALEVVISFFESQPKGSLGMQEGVLIGKLHEKIRMIGGESISVGSARRPSGASS